MKDRHEKVLRWGVAIAGSIALNAWFLSELGSIRYTQPKQPGVYQTPMKRDHEIPKTAPMKKKYEIPETAHLIPLVGEAYYFGPGQEPGAGAFYEGIMGGRGELGRVIAPADKEGLYLAFTKPGTICSACHEEKKILDMHQKKRLGAYRGVDA